MKQAIETKKRRERDIMDILVLHQLEVLNKEMPIVVHVGGFNGVMDIAISHSIPKAVIHTIEPCSKNFNVLKENVQENKRIKCYNVAIAGSIGTAILYTIQLEKYRRLGLSSQGNSLIEEIINTGRKNKVHDVIEQIVNTVTLDKFCKNNKIDRIDWLTFNCEGGEYDIFASGKPLKFLDRTNILDIYLHGKYKSLLTNKIIGQKLWIQKILKEHEFFPVWNTSNQKLKSKQAGHIRQLWFRKEMI